MTNGEKIQQVFPGCEVCDPIIEDDIIHVIFAGNPGSVIGLDYSWWKKEYKEPTIKNDLGVNCISRATVLDLINDVYNSDGFKDYSQYEYLFDQVDRMPAVTPQELIHGKCNQCKYYEGVHDSKMVIQQKINALKGEEMEDREDDK